MTDEDETTTTTSSIDEIEETDTDDADTLDVDNILIYLDGFVIVDDEEYPSDDTYNKAITTNEINKFYTIATANATSYLGYTDTDTINDSLLPFIYMWTAGLIYKKYDERSNDLIDENYPVGYGDQKIIDAKVGLKPYKKYSFTAW